VTPEADRWEAHGRQHDLESANVNIRLEAHIREHVLEKEGFALQIKEIDRRMEGLNQLRQQVIEDRGNFMSRETFEGKHALLIESIDARFNALNLTRLAAIDANDKAIGTLRDRAGALEGRFVGLALAATLLAAAATVISLVKP
jgi:hypothetical protein